MIRELSLDSKGYGKAGNRECQPLLNKAQRWRELAEDYLGELYSLQQAFEAIDQRYFDGQQDYSQGAPTHLLSWRSKPRIWPTFIIAIWLLASNR
jgi:hypothetical protein